jgi:hypothetical protein
VTGSGTFTFTGVTVTRRKTEVPPFEKEVVRLPDGRELTYYRFPEEAPRPGAGEDRKPPAGEER